MRKEVWGVCLIMCLAASLAMADWMPADGHKMHYPQLPDPNGWDVKVTTPIVLADDWKCSSSGPVNDIHFWGSWKGNQVGVITNVHVRILSDVPDPDEGGPLFSHPGNQLWQWDFYPVIKEVDPPSSQGWYNPESGQWVPNDHTRYFQYNIENIVNPFTQVKDTIYWLELAVTINPPPSPTNDFGWKTSQNHWNDDAVWRNVSDLSPNPWHELRDQSNNSLDLAFVITPEPGSMALLLIGGLAAALRRWR